MFENGKWGRFGRMNQKTSVFLFLLMICVSEFVVAKTRLHCFSITGQVFDSRTQKPVANIKLILKIQGKIDTIQVDDHGFYRYKVSFFPPCGSGLFSRSSKFKRHFQTLELYYGEKLQAIKYKPKKYLRVCDVPFGAIANPKMKELKHDLFF